MFYKFAVNTQRWRWRAHKQETAAALQTRFTKSLIDDLIKLLLLAAAMKYSRPFFFFQSLWLDGPLTSCSACTLFFDFCAKCVCLVFGLFFLCSLALMSPSWMKERRYSVPLGCVESPLFCCVGRQATLPKLFASLFFLWYDLLRICTCLFFPSRDAGHMYFLFICYCNFLITTLST